MPSDTIRGKQRQAEASRGKQRQGEASRGKQRQAEASTCFSASMLLGSVTRSFSSVRSRLWYHLMRRIRRQSELISEAQSALVPTDAPGHKCRALRHVRRLNHVSQPSHPKSCCNHVQSRAITCNHVQSRAITCNPAPKVLDDPRHASARDLVASAKGATRRDDESLDDVGEGRLARETDDNGREAPEG